MKILINGNEMTTQIQNRLLPLKLFSLQGNQEMNLRTITWSFKQISPKKPQWSFTKVSPKLQKEIVLENYNLKDLILYMLLFYQCQYITL